MSLAGIETCPGAFGELAGGSQSLQLLPVFALRRRQTSVCLGGREGGRPVCSTSFSSLFSVLVHSSLSETLEAIYISNKIFFSGENFRKVIGNIYYVLHMGRCSVFKHINISGSETNEQ